jgi:3-oxoacyl-ACP reductase-like protein
MPIVTLLAVLVLIVLQIRNTRTMNALSDKISALQGDVAALTAVDTSAVALLSGLSTQLAAAIQAAKDAGMTDEQAAELDSLHSAITGQTDALAAAVSANTPAAEPAPEPQPEG